MLVKAQHWGAMLFACEVSGCPKRKAANADLPRGWAKRVVGDKELVLCTHHKHEYDKGKKNLTPKTTDERAKFIG